MVSETNTAAGLARRQGILVDIEHRSRIPKIEDSTPAIGPWIGLHWSHAPTTLARPSIDTTKGPLNCYCCRTPTLVHVLVYSQYSLVWILTLWESKPWRWATGRRVIGSGAGLARIEYEGVHSRTDHILSLGRMDVGTAASLYT